jgi:hypothetical protein
MTVRNANSLSGPLDDVASDAGHLRHPPRMGFFTDTSVCIGCKAFTHIALAQVGGDTQPEFLEFAGHELLPALREAYGKAEDPAIRRRGTDLEVERSDGARFGGFLRAVGIGRRSVHRLPRRPAAARRDAGDRLGRAPYRLSGRLNAEMSRRSTSASNSPILKRPTGWAAPGPRR